MASRPYPGLPADGLSLISRTRVPSGEKALTRRLPKSSTASSPSAERSMPITDLTSPGPWPRRAIVLTYVPFASKCRRLLRSATKTLPSGPTVNIGAPLIKYSGGPSTMPIRETSRRDAVPRRGEDENTNVVSPTSRDESSRDEPGIPASHPPATSVTRTTVEARPISLPALVHELHWRHAERKAPRGPRLEPPAPRSALSFRRGSAAEAHAYGGRLIRDGAASVPSVVGGEVMFRRLVYSGLRQAQAGVIELENE